MTETNLEVLKSFDVNSLPDLDVVTLGALELLAHVDIPHVDFSSFKRPLVVGSGNAAVTGKLLFDDTDAIFADESSYVSKLDAIDSIDGAVLISASGSKHAVEIAQVLKERSIETILLTNNPDAPARSLIPEQNIFVFPRNREPYTYNTSTYMGMILSKTKEDPSELYSFLTETIAPLIPQNIGEYEAYYLMVPPECNAARELFVTKFDELFGPKVMGRVFTEEQTKHAKTVVPMDSELFISFGVQNEHYGLPDNRLYIPLPEKVTYAALMAIGYYVIGHIQKNKQPYFKERVQAYTEEISAIFGQEIKPIVE